MESVNIYKGYGQVSPLDMEDQHHHLPVHKPQPPPHRNPKRSTTIAILAVSAFLITLVVAITLAVVFGVSRSSHPRSQPHNQNSAESIRLVCNVTRYPDSCFASISAIDASPNPDPELILKLSVQVCLKQVVASLNISSSDSDRSEAMKECGELYEEARSQISDALEAIGGDGNVRLTEDVVNDVQTWLSAALTDQETCLDGLEEMKESVKLEELKVNGQKLKEYLSNSLAIVANIHPLLHKFGLQLH
ncbi:unnamed protein product [Rhodiola kirilowii]